MKARGNWQSETNIGQVLILTLISSLLVLVFQYVVIAGLDAEEYGIYRYSLVLYPAIIFLFNPGLDSIILSSKLSFRRFSLLQTYRFCIYALLLTPSLVIVVTYKPYFLSDIPDVLIVVLAMGVLISESAAGLRNYIYSHSDLQSVRMGILGMRILSILIGIILAMSIKLSVISTILVSMIMVGPGNLLSSIFLLIHVSRNNEIRCLVPADGKTDREFVVSSIKSGFSISSSSSLLLMVDMGFKVHIAEVLGTETFGYFSLLLLPAGEIQKIADTVFLSVHQRATRLYDHTWGRLVQRLKKESWSSLVMGGCMYFLYLRRWLLSSRKTTVGGALSLLVVSQMAIKYFALVEERMGLSLGIVVVVISLCAAKIVESWSRFAGVLRFRSRFDVIAFIFIIPAIALYYVYGDYTARRSVDGLYTAAAVAILISLSYFLSYVTAHRLHNRST